MENSEHRAKVNMRGHVHEINTTLTTFAFDKAFSNEFRELEYPALKLAAVEFLRDYVREQKRQQQEQIATLSQKWWTDKNSSVHELLTKMGVIYNQQHRFPFFHHHVVFEVAAELWSGKNTPCSLYHKLVFSSEKELIYAMEVSLTSLSQDGLLSDTDIYVFDSKNIPRKFETFPIRDSSAPDRRGLAVFFLPPLPPNERFTIQINEKANLHDADFKNIDYGTNRLGDYEIEKIDLVLHIPKNTNVSFSKLSDSPDGNPYDANLTKSLQIKGFDAIGWAGANIKLKKDQTFGAYINKK
jgi:hypothetical protein